MKDKTTTDHHLSKGGSTEPPGPKRLHHLHATGEKVDGETKPQGVAVSKEKLVGNARKTY